MFQGYALVTEGHIFKTILHLKFYVFYWDLLVFKLEQGENICEAPAKRVSVEEWMWDILCLDT